VVAIGRSLKRRVLGVSLGERAAMVAEVVWNGHGPRVTHAAEFRYPAGVTADDAAGLGAGLGALLRERGFSARQAVVGLPLKWLICRGQQIPPADAETAAAMLRLRAEAESAAELGDMVFDFAGQASESAASQVLLMGLPRKRLDAVAALATAAGLNPLAVTACGLALGAASSAAIGSNGLVVWVRADGAELLAIEQGQTRLMRHLGSAAGGLAGLIAELRRAAAVLPVAGGERELVVWDDVALDAEALEAIGGALGRTPVRGDVGRLGSATVEAGAAPATAPAISLALAGAQASGVDFLHPRIVTAPKRNISRRVVWGSAAAAAVLLVGALAYADLSNLERQVADTSLQLTRLDPSYRLAKPFVTDMQFAESFQSDRPRYLACLRDVTQVMPEGGQTYLTGFTLRANMTGDLNGRAAGTQDVLNLLEKLNASGRFTGLRRKIDARGTTNEVSFYVTFTYVPRP
jgi:hypothetical protein